MVQTRSHYASLSYELTIVVDKKLLLRLEGPEGNWASDTEVVQHFFLPAESDPQTN